MGAVPGVGIVRESKVDGYLRGQVFNRPQKATPGWLLLSIVYDPFFSPDFSIQGAGECPDLVSPGSQPRDCYKLAIYPVDANFYPRGALRSPPPSGEILADWQFSAEEAAINWGTGDKVRTIALNLEKIAPNYIFVELRREYSSGIFFTASPGLEFVRSLVTNIAVSIGREFRAAAQPETNQYARGSSYKLGTCTGELLQSREGSTLDPSGRLVQQYRSIGIFINTRQPDRSHLAPSDGVNFAPFPYLPPNTGNSGQYTGSDLGGGYNVDEGLL